MPKPLRAKVTVTLEIDTTIEDYLFSEDELKEAGNNLALVYGRWVLGDPKVFFEEDPPITKIVVTNKKTGEKTVVDAN